MLDIKPPTVLVVADISDFGGINTFIYSFIIYCIDNHFDIVIITKRDLTNKLSRLIKSHNIKHYIVKEPCINVPGPLMFFYPLIRIIVDLISIHRVIFLIKPKYLVISSTKPGNWWGLLLYPIQIRYFLHTSPSMSINIFYRLLSLVCINRNKLVITVSNYSKHCIDKYMFFHHIAAKNIRVIYNTDSNIKANKIPHKKVNILTVGSCERYKNPFLWLDIVNVFKNNSDYFFYWIGNGSLKKQMLQYVENNNLNNVSICNASDNLDSLFSITDIYVQPSIVESHGISVLDAMKNSIPCVVSDADGLMESIPNSNYGLIIHNANAVEYSKAIMELSSNSKMRSLIVSNAKQRFDDSFSKSVWYKQLNTIFCTS